MVAFGPVVGFLLGAFLLKLYVDFFTVDMLELQISPHDPQWVGAWWGGFIICGALLLIVAVPFFAFPKTLTKDKEKRMMLEKGTSPDPMPESPNKGQYGKSLKGRTISICCLERFKIKKKLKTLTFQTIKYLHQGSIMGNYYDLPVILYVTKLYKVSLTFFRRIIHK